MPMAPTSAQYVMIARDLAVPDHPFARINLDCGNFRKDGYKKEVERCPFTSEFMNALPALTTQLSQPLKTRRGYRSAFTLLTAPLIVTLRLYFAHQ